MEELDVVSWNSLIMGCLKSGYAQLALDQFCLMRSFGYSPDEFTCSAVITSCSNLQNLEKGKKILLFVSKWDFFVMPLFQVPLLTCFPNATDWRIQFGSLKNKIIGILPFAIP